ncbi:condensation domain-containing protein [Clostridium estertheticum]|uniref:condensation domain-containing protein n=1 Tax=Clostridium estertheticum TaxID=238834 RepID=UPI001C7D58A3|nr:condensation domain-containing protein [Clostridium estertheticum]MBX4264176.1 hypothetical protein [Clostridium estertheticum]WLC89035.1 hypothetical protein KTC95_02025 [Clostridium estertheticum]
MKNIFLKAEPTESTYWNFDGKTGCNTMYIVANVKTLNLEIFKESLKYIVKDIPMLACKILKGYWRDKWQPIENFDVSQIIETISVDKNSFYEKAYAQFLQLDEKRINLESEPALKVIIFYNEENEKKVIIFCIHHALADGRGCCEVVKLIANNYCTLLNNNRIVPQKNYRKMSKLLLSINLINILKMIYTELKNLFNPKLFKYLKPLIDANSENTHDSNHESIERIIVSKENIIKLKSLYKDYGFTVNDIILFLSTKLMSKYNRELKEPSEYVGAVMGMDLRRYLKKNILSITNFAIMKFFIVGNSETNDLPRMAENIKTFKNKLSGVGWEFINQVSLSKIFPVEITKYISDKIAKFFIIDGGSKMIITTNVGRIDDYVTSFGDIVESITFIAGQPIYGFPLVTISGYKDTVTLYFSKYNDENNLTKKVRDDFNELLNEIITKDLVK